MAELFLGGLVDPATHERIDGDVRLATEDLTTHGVIVGMTGSGKTGLGLVLIEEVLSAGLPALLIDPKGDLTNLCLTFPALDGASFRPWIDEVQARSADATPDDFATQQAALWKNGLAGWGERRRPHQRPAGGDRRLHLHARLAIGSGDQHHRLTTGA